MNEYYLLQDKVVYNSSISTTAQDYAIQAVSYKTQPQESIITLFEDKVVPLSIISGKSSLESIVIYLKEFSNLKFSDIAKLLNRDPRTIWVTYANAKKKGLTLDTLDIQNNSQLMLPLSIFYSRNFSVLENIVLYLRTTHSLSFNQISGLIGKNYQTVITVYKRALSKMDRVKSGEHER